MNDRAPMPSASSPAMRNCDVFVSLHRSDDRSVLAAVGSAIDPASKAVRKHVWGENDPTDSD